MSKTSSVIVITYDREPLSFVMAAFNNKISSKVRRVLKQSAFNHKKWNQGVRSVSIIRSAVTVQVSSIIKSEGSASHTSRPSYNKSSRSRSEVSAAN